MPVSRACCRRGLLGRGRDGRVCLGTSEGLLRTLRSLAEGQYQILVRTVFQQGVRFGGPVHRQEPLRAKAKGAEASSGMV